MKLSRRKFLHLAAGAAALPTATRFARALDYPTRPVHLIEGFGAGGAPDIVARLTGQALSERLGQSFVVENRTGASSNIAAEAVVRASPDGYTLPLSYPLPTYFAIKRKLLRQCARIARWASASDTVAVNGFSIGTATRTRAYCSRNCPGIEPKSPRK